MSISIPRVNSGNWMTLVVVSALSGFIAGMVSMMFSHGHIRAEAFDVVDKNGRLRARLSLTVPNDDVVTEKSSPAWPNLSFLDEGGHVHAEVGIRDGSYGGYVKFLDWVSGQPKLRTELYADHSESVLFLFQPGLKRERTDYNVKLAAASDESVLQIVTEAAKGFGVDVWQEGSPTMTLDGPSGQLMLGKIQQAVQAQNWWIPGAHIAVFDNKRSLKWLAPPSNTPHWEPLHDN